MKKLIEKVLAGVMVVAFLFGAFVLPQATADTDNGISTYNFLQDEVETD